MTIDVNSTMTTRQTFAVAQVIPQYRYSEGLGKRRLLTPDEVLRLPHDDMLVALRGQKILRLKKLDYTRLARKQHAPLLHTGLSGERLFRAHEPAVCSAAAVHAAYAQRWRPI